MSNKASDASTKEPNDMRQMTGMGRRIESGSFQVIDNEIDPHDFDAQQYEIVRRVVHATADIEYIVAIPHITDT